MNDASLSVSSKQQEFFGLIHEEAACLALCCLLATREHSLDEYSRLAGTKMMTAL